MDCKEGTRTVARQITGLLKLIDQHSYSKPLSVFNGSTIGQHFRHILDFYYCLFKGMMEGVVDYAARERDLHIEQDPEYALSAFESALETLEKLDEQLGLKVKTDFSIHEQDLRPVVDSSVGRELMFAYDHAVHHLAIIEIGIRSVLPDLPVNENIGVAPSTVKYRKGEQARER